MCNWKYIELIINWIQEKSFKAPRRYLNDESEWPIVQSTEPSQECHYSNLSLRASWFSWELYCKPVQVNPLLPQGFWSFFRVFWWISVDSFIYHTGWLSSTGDDERRERERDWKEAAREINPREWGGWLCGLRSTACDLMMMMTMIVDY